MSTRTIFSGDGRAWGYLGAMLGGLVSIGANTAHSYLHPAGAPVDWRPPVGAVIGAQFWPVALFVALEILARTSWPPRKWWIVVRFLGLVPVSVVAATVSYEHLSGLLAHYGEDRLTVVIGPLAVDGLMVMSSAAVMATAPGRGGAPSEAAAEPVFPPVPEPAPATGPEQREDEYARENPKPTRTTRKSTRRRVPVKRTWAELLAAAGALNAQALESTGKPVSVRQIKARLRVGQDTAARLREAATAPSVPIESGNGRDDGAEADTSSSGALYSDG